MPASVATQQPRYRERRQAIGRKTWFEAEFLMSEAEDLVAPHAEVYHSKEALPTPGSPTSVSSLFQEIMPEVKPMSLPEAWIVIGKRGRPLKNSKMYDEPKLPASEKKRSRRCRAAPDEDEDNESLALARLEALPSSSRCLQHFERIAMQRDKEVTRGLDAKKWARYRRAKDAKLTAHVTHVAVLVSEEVATEEPVPTAPQPYRHRAVKRFANSQAEKTRRKVRRAHAAERCWPAEDNEMTTLTVPMGQHQAEENEAKKNEPLVVLIEQPMRSATAVEGYSTGEDEKWMLPTEPSPHEQVAEKQGKGKEKQSTCSVM